MKPHAFQAVGVLVLATTLAWPDRLMTQAGPASSALAGAHFTQQSVQKTESVSRPVSLDVREVPLGEALREISRSSGVAVWYNDQILPAGVRVTYRGNNVRIEQALETVLKGTGIVFRFSADDRVTLGREAEMLDARPQGTVVGRVRHAGTRQPIAGATIRVDGMSRGIGTNADGTFRLALEAGEYTIHVRALGYERQARRVTVSADETVTLDLVLEPTANVLGEVVVTGSVVATERKAIPTPITVISAADIEKRGIVRIEQLFRGEVPGLLALEQGMNVYDNRGTENRGGTNYSVANTVGAAGSKMYSRGASALDGSPNPIKTFVDGVELLDPSYLGTIDPRSIERIEIITGPQAATIYGSGALGGVMQIFTKKGTGQNRTDMTLSLRYGALQSSTSNAGAPSHAHGLMINGGTGPALTYSVNVTYNYVGQWAPALFSRTYGGSMGATHTSGPLTVTGSVSMTNGSNGTLDVRNNTGGSPYVQQLIQQGEWNCGAAYAGISNCWQSFTNSQVVSKRSSQTLALNVDYKPGVLWAHHFTLGRSQNVFDLVPSAPRLGSTSDTMYSYNTSTGQRITTAYNITLMPAPLGALSNVVTFGVTGNWGENNGYGGTAPSKSSTSMTTANVRKIFDDKTFGGFGTWRLGLKDQLYLTLGVRAERNDAYGDQHRTDWTPTNGMTYTWERGEVSVKLLGSYGRATKAPSMLQRTVLMSTVSPSYTPAQYASQLENPFIRPEYEVGPQGGIEVYYGNRGSFTLNHYQQQVTDLLQRVLADSVERFYTPSETMSWGYQYQWQNIAKVRKKGWESTGSLNVGPFALRGTYSWNDSRVLDLGSQYTGTQYVGQSFLLIPTHMANITVGYAYRGTSVTWISNYVGTRPIDSNVLPVGLAWSSYARLQMYAVRRNSMAGTYRKGGYTKSDLVAQHRITAWASAMMNVTNVSNSFADDNFNSLAPSLGRQTQIGLTLRYPTTR